MRRLLLILALLSVRGSLAVAAPPVGLEQFMIPAQPAPEVITALTFEGSSISGFGDSTA